jgi:hydroxylaminobenzene mutase
MTMLTRKRFHQILMQGLLLVMAGLLWGFVVPATPYPRLALGAHIQFVTNGLLIIVMAALLLSLPNKVGQVSANLMLLAAWLTWPMALSEAANAWWGTNQMLPIAASQAEALGGRAWQELVVKVTHIAAGFGLVVAWGLLVVGFVGTGNGDGGQIAN